MFAELAALSDRQVFELILLFVGIFTVSFVATVIMNRARH